MESKAQCIDTLRSRINSILKDIEDDKTFICFGATESSDYIMAQCSIDAKYQEIDYIREHISKIESGEYKVYSEEDDYQEP